MNYTQDDLTSVKAAITDFVDGNRVGEFRTAGQTVKYADITLSELIALRSAISAALKPKRKRFHKIYTDKGLGG